MEEARAESPSDRTRGRGRAVASALGAALWLGTMLTACAGEREGGFESPVPSARLEAIEAVAHDVRATGRMPDRVVREELVECLNADDPLVRFMAIGTLREIAGDGKGYRHDDPEPIRRLAIPAWAAWAASPESDASATIVPSASSDHP